jgi:hypothetical protein
LSSSLCGVRASMYRACPDCGAWPFVKRDGCAACEGAPGPVSVIVFKIPTVEIVMSESGSSEPQKKG